MEMVQYSKYLSDLREKAKTIYTADATCGAGKTYAFCHHASDVLCNRNLLYVAPTQLLLDQTSAGLRDLGLKPECISDPSHRGRVKRSLLESLSDAPPLGHLICCTFNAFIDLPHSSWFNDDDWQVVIDEVPPLDRYHSWKLPRQKQLLTDLLYVDTNANENGLVVVRVKDPKASRKRLAMSMDDVENVFRDFLTSLLSENKVTFVSLENWNRVMEDAGGRSDDGEIRFLTLLKPKPFIGSILMGANIADSLLYHRFTRKHGFKFVPYDPIVSKLRGSPDISDRLCISYFIPRRHVSRRMLDKPTSNGTSVQREMDLAALGAFDGEPFLHVKNKLPSVLDDCPTAKQIPAISHGLNDYADYSNIYIGGSFNRKPEHFNMLRCVGLEAKDVYRASNHEMIYQAVMRTSLRDPSSSAMVHAIVPDEPAARRLAEITGAKRITKIDIDLNMREPLTQLHRQQRHAARSQLRMMFQDSERDPFKDDEKRSDSGFGLIGGLHSPPDGRTLASLANSNELEGAEFSICVTLHETVDPYVSTQLREETYSIREFKAMMKLQSGNIVDEKEELNLLNASTFKLPAVATLGSFKTNEHRKQTAFVVLDFDGGNMSIQDFIRIFWDDVRSRRSFLIHSSFSASPEKPNYFRAFMFCKKPIETREQYAAIYEEIVARMERDGFSAAAAKLDERSKVPVQSWYLPGRSRKHPEMGYFNAFGTRGRELARYAFDPEECLKRRPNILTFDDVVPSSSRDRNPEAHQISERQLEELSKLTETRHEAIFVAVRTVKNTGASDAETRDKLRQATHYDPKMLKKINDDLKRFKPWKGQAWMKGVNGSPSSNNA